MRRRAGRGSPPRWRSRSSTCEAWGVVSGFEFRVQRDMGAQPASSEGAQMGRSGPRMSRFRTPRRGCAIRIWSHCSARTVRTSSLALGDEKRSSASAQVVEGQVATVSSMDAELPALMGGPQQSVRPSSGLDTGRQMEIAIEPASSDLGQRMKCPSARATTEMSAVLRHVAQQPARRDCAEAPNLSSCVWYLQSRFPSNTLRPHGGPGLPSLSACLSERVCRSAAQVLPLSEEGPPCQTIKVDGPSSILE